MFDIIFTLAMAGMAAYGQIKQGRAAKKAAESQAQAAEMSAQQQEFNAHVADTQARDAEVRGEDQAGRLREQVRGLIGTQRSGYAGQGVVVTNGSAADVQADAQALGETDVRTIRANAQREAWGFRVDAENSRRNAGIARQGGVIALKEGRAAQTAGYLGAATTIVGATGTAIEQRYGWKKTTTPTSSRAPLPSQTAATRGKYNAGMFGTPGAPA